MTGFDTAFLGAELPLPETPGETIVLDYEHFTIAQSVERRLAYYAAVTIDGSALVDVERSDDWREDPRAGDAQVGEELYRGNDLDRGHLVRRRDPVWGDTAERANSDTFHYTNAAPQVNDFNQSKQLWLGLEDYLLEHARRYDGRLSVITGPVFSDGDPLYRDVRIPRRFWKVAAWHDGDGLAATAYLLDQTALLADLGIESVLPPLGGFRTFQVGVDDVTALTGLEMPALVEADRFDVRSVAGRRWRELEYYEEIAL